MRSVEILYLKAFLVAVSQQASPLPEDVQTQINEIFAALETRVRELKALALATPSLKAAYETAYSWFSATSAERKAGLKFLPSEEPHDETGERINITHDSTKAIAEMEKVLEIIDRDYENAAKTLSKPNPIQNFQQFLKNRLNR
ncbi:MAG: hypothetical protein AAGA60_26915 [Cyanobacteria bacterium P01_E01_bin.42]